MLGALWVSASGGVGCGRSVTGEEQSELGFGAGSARLDAGGGDPPGSGSDAGMPPPDAGMPPPDAGIPLDASPIDGPDGGDSDYDHDGIPDASDNCPMVGNPDQLDGDGDHLGNACDTCASGPVLLDDDKDERENACDNCPLRFNPAQLDSDSDGVGDACDPGDSDGDGFPDASDNCSAVANPSQADGDGDGTGDACENGDLDGDGIRDVSDNCQLFANPAQTDGDGDGVGDACESGDGDNDGIDDAADNCPTVANPSQADVDRDGTGDACENLPPSDGDADGVPDPSDNCPFAANPAQTDSDLDGRGDACDPPICDVLPAFAAKICKPAPPCDETWRGYKADVSLQSTSHHAPAEQHIYNPPPGWTADYFESCSGDKCAGFRRHGRSATVHWEAKCTIVQGRCTARVRVPDPYATNQTNFGGSNYHWHGLEPEHGCAFIDNGNGTRKTNECKVNGSEKVEAVPDMTVDGDGVVYGTGYAANHDSAAAPSLGLSVGYRGAGAFVIINNATAATYTKAMGWAQGMGCNAQGVPYKLTTNGDGRDYPWASSGEGSE